MERNKERLFEEPLEVQWEKGGSGLVFYTDAQYWDQQEGGRLQAFPNLSVWRPKLAKPYSGLLNPPIHLSKWPTKARAVLE